MSPNNCLYAYNLVATEEGVTLRSGYREWQIDVIDTASFGVNTLISFVGDVGDTDDRLFAVTNEGIWDVTGEAGTPSKVYAFTIDNSNDAGRGVYVNYVDQSGEQWVFYADSTNGLFQYRLSTDTWTTYADVTGVDVADVCFIMVHKQRVWMIERDASSAWYLPLSAIAGAATQFFFGTKFPHGGLLTGLYNWSVDGGVGVDDYLVAVSATGDVIPYQGGDPSGDDWGSKGTYFIGAVPAGRRIAGEYAGDLYFLSSYGVVAMSDLLRGVDAGDVTANSLSFKIAKLLRSQLVSLGTEYGWSPRFLPSQGTMLITSPKVVGYPDLQYSLSLPNTAWGFWRGVPIAAMVEWRGKVYIGSPDSKVHVMDTTRDGIEITPADPANNGTPVPFSILTSYSRLGQDSLFKQVQFTRPDFLSATPPNYEAVVLYDYQLAEIPEVTGVPLTGGSLWGVAEWDAAVWGGTGAVGSSVLAGASGLGRAVAVAIRGDSSDEANLLSIDVMWTSGGPV
jgi:hypothetical protein